MSQSDNRLPYTRRGHKPGRGRRLDAPCALRKTNTVGGHSICPRCMEFYLNNAAAHLLICLPAAGARKRGFLKKAPS